SLQPITASAAHTSSAGRHMRPSPAAEALILQIPCGSSSRAAAPSTSGKAASGGGRSEEVEDNAPCDSQCSLSSDVLPMLHCPSWYTERVVCSSLSFQPFAISK